MLYIQPSRRHDHPTHLQRLALRIIFEARQAHEGLLGGISGRLDFFYEVPTGADANDLPRFRKEIDGHA